MTSPSFEQQVRVAVAGANGRVGRLVTASLRENGHEVVELSRSHGLDLTHEDAGPELRRRLAGVDVVMDLTNVITQDRATATTFFSTVARNLASAATAAGVRRTVLLSILGVDRIPVDAHYAAKHAQEQVHLEHSPEPHVVRAAHFHEFAEMALGWGRDGSRTTIPDFPVQPVDLEAVVSTLLVAATRPDADRTLEIAGPRVERLPDLVRRFSATTRERLTVIAGPASVELGGGACLAGPETLVAGGSFDDWLAARVSPTH